MHTQQPAVHASEEKVPTTRQKLRKRRRSSLSSAGDDAERQTINDDAENSEQTPNGDALSRPTLGNLYERRASTSPEKFDKGRFEPLPLRTGRDAAPPVKRMRVEKKIEVIYDSDGTPRVSSWSSKLPDGTPDIRGQPSIQLPNNPTKPSITPLCATSPQPSDAFLSPTAQALPTEQLKTSCPATSKRTFSLIHAICRDDDLLLHFASFLTIPSLISLYSMSKPFHVLFNRHHTAFILAVMRTWAPGADTIFPWHCYKSLCVKDPSKRQKKRLQGRETEMKHKWEDLREVPSLKWLQMVVWRQGVCKDICIQLAVNGLRCPPGTLDALRRMWFLMDLPLNAHRIALIRTPAYISNRTLHLWTFFMLKTDMMFTDPYNPPYPINHPNLRRHPRKHNGAAPSGVPLRKMLLAERNLTPLWRVLRGWSWDPNQPQLPMTRLDVLRLWVRHRYTHPDDTPEHVKKQSIMSIPWWEVGTAGYERTGVSFFNLADGDDGGDKGKKQGMVSHPAIAGSGLTETAQQSLLYPHQRRIVLAHEKPREKLLRPDQLLIREGIRRKLGMHRKWAGMMLYGFCDEVGRPWPKRTEEELLRMGKGLPAKLSENEELEDEETG